jgi:hypothetical protein
MNATIADALAEATAEPAPEGTLEFQAEAMTPDAAPRMQTSRPPPS